MTVLTLTNENFDDVVLNSTLPVVVDFWATWCGPCKMIAPVLEELSAEMADKIVFTKLDTDQFSDIAVRFGIRSLPTLLVFNNGEIIDKQLGAAPKDNIKQWLENAISNS